MNDNNDVDSDSDVSSNSSWTVLDETPDQTFIAESNEDKKKNDGKNQIAGTISTTELFPEIEIIENDSLLEEAQPPNVNKTCDKDEKEESGEFLNYGCLTLEEYLKEREIEYDYEYDAKRIYLNETADRKPKPDKHKRKKCKAESIGTLAIIGTVLAIAGVSFLCLLTPNNYVLTGKEREKLETTSIQILNTPINASQPICSVICDKEKKVTLLDPEGVLQKCLKKNATSPRQAKKCLKSSKQFKTLKTLNLLNNNETITLDNQSSGPVSYEDYLKQTKQHLKSIRHNARGIKEILKKAPILKEAKNDNTLQVFERPSTSKAHAKKNIEEIRLPKTCLAKEKKTKEKIPENLSNVTRIKNQKCPKPKIITENGKGKEVKKNEVIKYLKEPKKVTEREEEIRSSYYTNSDAIRNVVQDLMLLRMTSKIARRIREKQEAKRVKINRKALSLRKQNPSSTCSIIQSKLDILTEKENRKTLRLLDQLPFSKRKRSKKSSKSLIKRSPGKSKENPNMDKKQKLNSNPETVADLKRKLESRENLQRDIRRDMENLTNKQTEFLEKLRQQQAERMEVLKEIRERQQQSIRDLIEERFRRRALRDLRKNPSLTQTKTQENTALALKDVSCGQYDVPIPTAVDINQRLLALRNKSSCEYQKYPHRYFDSNSTSSDWRYSSRAVSKSNCKVEEPKPLIPHEFETNSSATDIKLTPPEENLNLFPKKESKVIPQNFPKKSCLKLTPPKSEENFTLFPKCSPKESKVIPHEFAKNPSIKLSAVTKSSSTEIKLTHPESEENFTIFTKCPSTEPEVILHEFAKAPQNKSSSTEIKLTPTESEESFTLFPKCPSITENKVTPRDSEKSSSSTEFKNLESTLCNSYEGASKTLVINPECPQIYSLPVIVDEEKVNNRNYDNVAKYWKKREDYLNRSGQVKDTIKVLMEVYKKNQNTTKNISETVLMSMIKEIVSSHPDIDFDLSEFSLEETKEVSNGSSSSETVSTNATDPAVFNFTAGECQVISPKSMNLKKDAIYNYMFGRKGQQIRTRDLAMWFDSRIAKKKRCREISKHDMRRLNGNRKAKEEF